MTVLLILFITALSLLFGGLAKKRNWLLPLATTGTLAGIGAAAAKMAGVFTESWSEGFSEMLLADSFADAFTLAVLISMLLLLGLAGFGFRHLHETLGDHLVLIFFSLCGAVCMFAFQNVTMLFLGIEILSIPLYVLAGLLLMAVLAVTPGGVYGLLR